MNLEKNGIPEDVKKIHLIAVCGTGMGALACMLMELGFQVSGSDHAVYPPMSDFLREKGITLIDGYHEDNLSHEPDLVIVGNAVKKDNPEVLKMVEQGIPFCSMPQALSHFAGKDKKTVIITGTHGKTTTSSLMSWVLFSAGLDPSFMVGGILKNFNSNYRIGQGAYFVVEGDEYDTAFFDKGAKFFHYSPYIAVLTSIEFDHADIFPDLSTITRTFDKFISNMTADSTLVAYRGDSNVKALVNDRETTVVSYGKGGDAFWQIGNLRIEFPHSVFDVTKGGEFFGTFKTKLMGEYNLLNALSVIASADRIGISVDKIAHAIETFESAKRRQEVRGVKNGITVMDDFAHHPTAVFETIKGVKNFYPEKRLIAVFEPKTNSSKRNVFQEIYPDSFAFSDLVCIKEPEGIETIPEKERFSCTRLVSDLEEKDKSARYFKDTQEIITYLKDEARSGDIILIMSSGGFDNIHQKLLDQL